ncbi:MAG TPA: ParB N-terminal domain-containing protein [Anaerolineae bacterium]
MEHAALAGTDEARVANLVESIRRVGLLHAITVERRGIVPNLTAGHHRLAAIKRIGWDEVECYVLPEGDGKAAVNAEIAHIDENLIRGRLTDAEMAAMLHRRQELFEIEFPDTKAETAGGKAGGRGRPKDSDRQNGSRNGFVAATAKATGKSERTVHRATARGRALGESALSHVKGTSLDKGVELDALVKLLERARIERAASGEQM